MSATLRCLTLLSVILFGFQASSAVTQTPRPSATAEGNNDSKTITFSISSVEASSDKLGICLWKQGKQKGGPTKLDCTTNPGNGLALLPASSKNLNAATTRDATDGTYKLTFDAAKVAGYTYFSAFDSTSGSVLPSAGVSALPAKASAAAPGNSGLTQDVKVSVNMKYCDRSLPYSYTLGSGSAWKAQATISVYVDPAWRSWFKQQYKTNSLSPTTPKVDFEKTLPTIFNFAEPNDPIGTDHTINDLGFPILADPSQFFTTNTFDAQRLLTRSLFGPNVFSYACSFDYLSNKVPPSPNSPTHDAAGKPENFLANGLSKGKPFNLNDPSNPGYYLINIVRWEDAPTPAGGSTSPQLYQAASNDWYLLNYSNKKDAHHDAFTLIKHFKPEMLPSTVNSLAMVGEKSVVFIGIHLAPQPAIPVSQPTTAPSGLGIAPTEAAWYTTDIEYDFKASHVDPINVQDFKALMGILESNVPGLLSGQANAAASPNAAGGTPANAQVLAWNQAISSFTLSALNQTSASLENLTTRLNTIIDLATQNQGQKVPAEVSGLVSQAKDLAADADALNKEAPANLGILLRYSSVTLNPVDIANVLSAADRLTATSGDSGPTCSAAVISSPSTDNSCFQLAKSALNIANQAAVARDSNFKAPSIPTTTSAALIALTSTLKSLASDIEEIRKVTADPEQLAQRSVVYSLDQGQYAATIINNLQDLPIDLTGAWTTTFASVDGTPKAADANKPTVAQPDTAPGSQTNAAYNGVTAQATLPKTKTVTDASSSATTTNTANSPICMATLDTSVTTRLVQTKCSPAGVPVHDEDLARWDFSLIVPVTGYKDITFQASTPPSTGGTTPPNVITANSVTRENAYAMFDFMPFGQDLVTPPIIGIPYLSAGLPLAGKVFDKPYFAVGETFTLPKAISNSKYFSWASKYLPLSINPSFGWVANKIFPTTVDSSNALHTAPYRSWRPQYAIGFSFRSISSSVKTALSKSNSSSNSKNTSTSTTGSVTQ